MPVERARIAHRLLTLALLAAAGGPSRALDVEAAPADWKPQAFPACSAAECSFEDRMGTNRYLLREGTLSRLSGGSEVYRRPLTGKYEKTLLSGISGARNQLVVAIARERISLHGLSGFTTTDVHAKDVEREHRLEIVNPKSGDTIKSIDLGPFRPQALALSEHGEQVLLYGRDLQLWVWEVRLYNTRSGGLEHRRAVEASAEEVVLAHDGYAVGAEGWRLAPAASEKVRRFRSRDPYSIAEYEVGCSGLLDRARFEGKALAVMKFEGAGYELGQMLANSLALKLGDAGLKLVERQRLEEIADEQWLQTTGLTEEATAVAIGRLANAHYQVLGSLHEAGTTAALSLRLVGVEDGAWIGGCEVTCRDCRPDDYLEALDHLVATWVSR
jgi:hypothetical protein